jgi:xanthine/CO dehydrogenase XdhC/CoxF family maturation factor
LRIGGIGSAGMAMSGGGIAVGRGWIGGGCLETRYAALARRVAKAGGDATVWIVEFGRGGAGGAPTASVVGVVFVFAPVGA